MSKTIIYISSCDLYSESWRPMLDSIKRFWPDCPFPIYILSNYLDPNDGSAIYCKVGEHKGWAENTKKAFKNIDADYVIHLHEDYFLVDKVDTTAILNHIKHCEENDLDYLRLAPPFRKEDKRIGQSDYCSIKVSGRYAINMQPSIFKVSKYLEFCQPNWSCWDFEYKINNYLNNSHTKFQAEVIHESLYPKKGFPLIPGTGIRKGRWTRAAHKYLLENGYADIAQLRKTEGLVTDFLQEKCNGPILKYPRTILIRIIQRFNINI